MTTSMKVMLGVIVFDIILVVIFSLIGSFLINADSEFDTGGITDTESLSSINTSEVGITDAPNFLKSFSFALSGMPNWFSTLLLIPQIALLVAFLFWLRGV